MRLIHLLLEEFSIFSLKIMALLKYDWHTMEFTFLECTSQWFLVYSQSFELITTNSRTAIFFYIKYRCEYLKTVKSLKNLVLLSNLNSLENRSWRLLERAELQTVELNFVKRIHIRPLLWDFLPNLSILFPQMYFKIRAFIRLFNKYLLNMTRCQASVQWDCQKPCGQVGGGIGKVTALELADPVRGDPITVDLQEGRDHRSWEHISTFHEKPRSS